MKIILKFQDRVRFSKSLRRRVVNIQGFVKPLCEYSDQLLSRKIIKLPIW